jgi:hypothetical protein
VLFAGMCHSSFVKIGRNDPCPCGSGKKYKKCCLAQDEARALEFRQQQSASPAGADSPWNAEPDILMEEQPADLSDGTPCYADLEDEDEMPESDHARKYPRVDETLPDLSAEEDAVVEKWWADVSPLFERRDADEMLRRVEWFLENHPALFPHLWLTEEFLFELGAEFHRREQGAVYANLLERLRRDQPRAYSFCFGFFDYDLIAEKIVSGRTEEISPCLSFFKQYPDSHPDKCHALFDLLAWRGLEAPLHELAEAVAVPLLTSREVINGGFAMEWLVVREFVPFLETRDASESAAAAVMEGLQALSARLDYKLTPKLESIRRRLQMASASPDVLELRQHKARDEHFFDSMEWNFMGHLRAHHRITWAQARLAIDRLGRYVWWHAEEDKDPFQFKPADVERCLVQTCKDFLWLDGVRLVTMVQMLAWLADFLKCGGGISEAKRQEVRGLCRKLFEKARPNLDAGDPARRLCPPFDELAPEVSG